MIDDMLRIMVDPFYKPDQNKYRPKDKNDFELIYAE